MPVNADTIIARNNVLRTRASNFRNLWEECSRYCVPRKGRITTDRQEGDRASEAIFDTTAEESLLIFGSGLLQYLTPSGQIWARIESSEAEPSEALREWFDRESEGLMEDLHNGNFYEAIHEAYLSLGAFGTCAVLLEEGDRGPLNFREAVVGSFAIAEDNEGRVDTVFREWKWSARQAEQEWGRQLLGKQVLKALESKNPADADREFTFIHAVFPRRGRSTGLMGGSLAGEPSPNAEAVGADGVARVVGDEVVEAGFVAPVRRPIASVYVCVEDRQVVLEDGYYEMPYAVCRLLRSNGEVYGRGPSMQVLPNLRLVNEMEALALAATERAVDPPWLMADDAAYRPDNRPGGITYYDAMSAGGKPEQLQSAARIDISEQKMEQIRERISRAWFVPMFHALNNEFAQKRQKTAFEVEQMLQEKMADFSPMFARVTRELLSVLLERAFAIRLRSGRAVAPPVELGESLAYKISYTGEIALRIKAMQDKGTVQAAQLAAQFAQLEPSVLHVVKWRERFRDMVINLGVPMSDLRGEEEVEEILQAEREAQEAAAEAQQLQAVAGAVKDVGAGARGLGPEALAGGGGADMGMDVGMGGEA